MVTARSESPKTRNSSSFRRSWCQTQPIIDYIDLLLLLFDFEGFFFILQCEQSMIDSMETESTNLNFTIASD